MAALRLAVEALVIALGVIVAVVAGVVSTVFVGGSLLGGSSYEDFLVPLLGVVPVCAIGGAVAGAVLVRQGRKRWRPTEQ